jgi:hypothetical protein
MVIFRVFSPLLKYGLPAGILNDEKLPQFPLAKLAIVLLLSESVPWSSIVQEPLIETLDKL